MEAGGAGTPSYAQESLLEGLREPNAVLGIKSGSVMYKTTLHSLSSPSLNFLFGSLICSDYVRVTRNLSGNIRAFSPGAQEQ